MCNKGVHETKRQRLILNAGAAKENWFCLAFIFHHCLEYYSGTGLASTSTPEEVSLRLRELERIEQRRREGAKLKRSQVQCAWRDGIVSARRARSARQLRRHKPYVLVQ